ncbi:DUF3560 domain-containing protein [Lentzea sp. NPDC051213]|uniref:DUF3560 domain-containing protein n=1 Tax=Lentzea sp. NPDC051213 TaxID=3364126 RepID=UPI00379C10CE
MNNTTEHTETTAPDQVLDQAQEPDLVLGHTSADGTTVVGSRKGDGVLAALRGTGVQWRATRDGVLYIPRSRDKAPYRYRIEQAATALRELGFTVSVEIDGTPRDAAQVRADKHEQAERRAEALDGKAARLSAASSAARATVDRISERFAGGQPILVDHYSAPKAFRDRDRMHAKTRQAIDLDQQATTTAWRADAARTTAASLGNPITLARRMATVQTDLRGIDRELAGNVRRHLDGHGNEYMRTVTKPAEGAWRTQLLERQQHLQAELEHSRELYAEHVREGRAWGGTVADIKPGDLVKTHNDWGVVVKVNPTTIVVDTVHMAGLKRPHFEIQDHRPRPAGDDANATAGNTTT